ncbi:MAG: hypothetical protein C0481_18245 [Phenylobacterium sp.]|uniref:hypothetical protein n=1 Tax=Phenylobacterium sp. TaxID=1871053 RepID=UPI0025D08AE4|nr:hypothetical protein [Phenylobacterium sp.]MBA4013807.1 hypothetical protein [Phenylobacterium sp.]
MKPVALVLAAAALPAAAHAGETACWFEQGVVVAPASIDGLAGDYILDTGAPVTQLHETKAQGAGLVELDQRGPVRIAGLTLPDRRFVIADLDARTYAFPTPIAGVIGADLLSAYVVEVSFAPCKVAIYPRGQAPRVHSKVTVLPLHVAGGVATARAAVADGPSALAGDFVIATGSDTAVRVAQDHAAVPGAAKPQELLPYGETRAQLRAASFAGRLFENLEGGLSSETEADGVIGAPLLARWRLRFDFPGGKLLLAPAG